MSLRKCKEEVTRVDERGKQKREVGRGFVAPQPCCSYHGPAVYIQRMLPGSVVLTASFHLHSNLKCCPF